MKVLEMLYCPMPLVERREARVARVASENLVPAVSREYYGNVFFGLLCHEVRRQCSNVCRRLVHVPRHLRKRPVVGRIHLQFRMLGTEVFSDHSRKLHVIGIEAEVYGKSFYFAAQPA